MTISLRNIPPELERAIVDKSKRDGISLNKAAIRLLEGAIRPRRRNTDFDEFIGSWTTEEASEFDAVLAEMRKLDPED
ncbi:MAG: hypothetical protein HYX27_01410 [Acidobacteria bacterium]|nr:hypothetical protein [Acidobacteriota bacterium]